MGVRLFALVSALAVFVLAAVPASASTSQPKFNPPKSFYLALGDSLAFGYQGYKFTANFPTENPSAFATGYVDDFATMLQGIDPGIQTINFACPDESTVTFRSGQCPYTAFGFSLHNGYSGSQLDAALGFLHAHPGEVSPITIDLGVNDVNVCTDTTCALAQIQVVAVNMGIILSALRDAAPGAEIIVMQYYNPFGDPTTNFVAQALNAALESDAAAIRGRVADAFTPFNLGPAGTLCLLTLICATPPDVHASDAGYVVIAQQFWAASEYSRLVD
jgi:lysophospholipase L1-like esterase